MLSHRRPLLVAALLVLVGVGAVLLATPDGDASRRHVVVGGVPLDEVHPPAAGQRRPGVVVAHGFAGSARLMAQFGDTLAARGYVVVLPDFAGHGANRHTLPPIETDPFRAVLDHDLGVAVAHLRGLPDVDPARVSLVGHSMGAGAVTRFAAAHPEITATVAISLPDAAAVRAGRPARLLPIVGGLEFAGFQNAATGAAEQAGEGQAAVVVPGVEHISILYASRTHRETADWLDNGSAEKTDPSPVRRVGGAGILLVVLLVGLYPVAWLLLGAPLGRWPRLTGSRLGRTVVVAAVAAPVTAVVASVLPTVHLMLAVGGYVVGYTATAGAAILAYTLRRRPNDRGPAADRRRLAFAAPLLIGYAAVTIAVPTHLGLTHAVPVGARWWLLPVVWAGFTVLAYAAERLAGGNSIGVLAVSTIAVLALTGAAVAGLTDGFVVLVVPLLAVLLVFQAAWSAVLHRFSAPPWLIALVGSLLVTWPIATTLPVIG